MQDATHWLPLTYDHAVVLKLVNRIRALTTLSQIQSGRDETLKDFGLVLPSRQQEIERTPTDLALVQPSDF